MSGAENFYVTIKRGRRTSYIAGPFQDYEEARAHIDPARKAAEEVDPFTWFDFFGVTRVFGPAAAALPPGVLNSRLGLGVQ